MMIVDTLLAERQRDGKPVRVALAGSGFMGRGLVNQIVNSVPGMDVVAIMARKPEQARRAFTEAGVESMVDVDDAAALDRAAAQGIAAIASDIQTITEADSVDVIVDVTGAVEFGAHLALAAFAGGKHLVLMNAEVDATVGPELARRADAAGVVYTGCDGDQPGVQMNLIRFVKGMGLTPLVAGNIKGLQDPYRNPTTQKGFAEKWGQDPHMVTSFADGTKVSVEQALVANAAGMSVHKRGMLGRDHREHIDTLTAAYDVDELVALGGAVDYVVGAQPGPGIYVFATHDDPKQRHYLNLYKLGEGPLYSFYTPYHLCHFEVPNTVARAALLGDATIRPLGDAYVEVVTIAKTDLTAGTVLDGLGGYHYYGEAERADTTATEGLLPVGVAEGARLLRDIAKDSAITYADVELPTGRLVDELRIAQQAHAGRG
jgi:predicted homoserine dehydrogenase-like protein